MTNLALALRKDPTIAKKVRHLYFMGGANKYPGNVTPAAEFNIWVDPDAARIVLDSGMPATMVGCEICMRHGLLGPKECAEIERMNTRESRFFVAVNRRVRRFMKETHGFDGTSCPDSMTMAIVLNPRLATSVKKRFVEVDNQSEMSRGATVVDETGILGRRPNVAVVYEASEKGFRRALYNMLLGGRV